MRLILLVLLINTGCAGRGINWNAFKQADSSSWQDRPNPEYKPKQTDYQCMSDCQSRYSKSLCESKCSY